MGKVSTDPDRPYKCDKCEATFKQRPALKNHLSTHDPATKNRFPCPWEGCTQGFRTKNSMTIHCNAIHIKELKEACLYCPFKSTYPAALTKHYDTFHPGLQRMSPSHPLFAAYVRARKVHGSLSSNVTVSAWQSYTGEDFQDGRKLHLGRQFSKPIDCEDTSIVVTDDTGATSFHDAHQRSQPADLELDIMEDDVGSGDQSMDTTFHSKTTSLRQKRRVEALLDPAAQLLFPPPQFPTTSKQSQVALPSSNASAPSTGIKACESYSPLEKSTGGSSSYAPSSSSRPSSSSADITVHSSIAIISDGPTTSWRSPDPGEPSHGLLPLPLPAPRMTDSCYSQHAHPQPLRALPLNPYPHPPTSTRSSCSSRRCSPTPTLVKGNSMESVISLDSLASPVASTSISQPTSPQRDRHTLPPISDSRKGLRQIPSIHTIFPRSQYPRFLPAFDTDTSNIDASIPSWSANTDSPPVKDYAKAEDHSDSLSTMDVPPTSTTPLQLDGVELRKTHGMLWPFRQDPSPHIPTWRSRSGHRHPVAPRDSIFTDPEPYLRLTFKIPPDEKVSLSALADAPERGTGRPNYSLHQLAVLAIFQSSDHMATLAEIRTAIQDRFPFFAHPKNEPSFCSSIRHMLSYHSVFVKAEHPTNRRSTLWTLNVDLANQTKRQRKRRSVQSGEIVAIQSYTNMAPGRRPNSNWRALSEESLEDPSLERIDMITDLWQPNINISRP
ncbi:hypothetical protein CYLTODRAFT_490297 [Cylindrobasidium torrendii FP15055 ss-10]|uniref:Fork-head domain-containing protein n=1 Tax=Cylindrobasidium torrendii FP15055 ss-10 TaxID=1314674 RepID=A0A0D7BDZ1_9AGAR|nr:hypothetical protein CYLTODRAFT_490297 [Cylindrobasidium torrendii FP15055 ss-10]